MPKKSKVLSVFVQYLNADIFLLCSIRFEWSERMLHQHMCCRRVVMCIIFLISIAFVFAYLVWIAKNQPDIVISNCVTKDCYYRFLFPYIQISFVLIYQDMILTKSTTFISKECSKSKCGYQIYARIINQRMKTMSQL